MYYLTLTLGCHSHNGFGVASGAGFESQQELDEHWNSIPGNAPQEEVEFEWGGDKFSFIVDLNGDDQTNILDDKFITKELAVKITGNTLDNLVKKGLDDLRVAQPFSFVSFSSYKAATFAKADLSDISTIKNGGSDEILANSHMGFRLAKNEC
jgi:hypothetical protein